MIPLRSIPTLVVSFAALAFVAWGAALSHGSGGLYADPPSSRDSPAAASAR